MGGFFRWILEEYMEESKVKYLLGIVFYTCLTLILFSLLVLFMILTFYTKGITILLTGAILGGYLYSQYIDKA